MLPICMIVSPASGNSRYPSKCEYMNLKSNAINICSWFAYSPMICAKRYQDSIRAYEAQLEHEIKQNIDFQRTASDACYFMR